MKKSCIDYSPRRIEPRSIKDSVLWGSAVSIWLQVITTRSARSSSAVEEPKSVKEFELFLKMIILNLEYADWTEGHSYGS